MSVEGTRKSTFFVKNGIKKGKGRGGTELPPIALLSSEVYQNLHFLGSTLCLQN